MKPDQHKKKRSSQYKKKHGIPNNKAAKSGNGLTEKSQSAETSSSANDLNAHVVERLGEEETQKSTISTSSSSSSSENRKEITPSFSRRNIQSNWDRYEGLPDDDEAETVTSRGIDFKRLLSETGHAEAQFRLKDEQSWGEDEALDMEAGSKILSVDFDALARHVKAIPLPERLGIARSLFEVDLLEKLDKEAEKHASDVKGIYEISSHQSQPVSSSSSLSRTFHGNTEDNSLADFISDLSLQETQPIPNPKRTDLKESLKASLPAVTVHGSKVTGHHGDTDGLTVEDSKISSGKLSHQSTKEKLEDEDEDDELAFLLSLENPVQVKEQNLSMNDSTKEETKVNDLDDVDSTITHESPVLQTTCQPSVTPEHDGTDDLEDWLDDMLED